MADNYPAQIWIGGKVKSAVVKGLVEALHSDGASDDYGNPAIPEDCTNWDGLALYLDNESLLTLKDDQAHNGEFPATEAFCVEHDIAFDRWGDHYHEYDAENVHWRPGMKGVMVTYADSNGKEIVDGETVRLALANVVAYQKTATHVAGERDEDLLCKAERLLIDACPPKPPNLETFEII